MPSLFAVLCVAAVAAAVVALMIRFFREQEVRERHAADVRRRRAASEDASHPAD